MCQHNEVPGTAACIHRSEPESPPTSLRDEIIDEARTGSGLSRRGILGGLGAMTALGVGSTLGASSPAAAAPKPKPGPGPRRGAELVLLGTRAGPPPVPSQAGISSALVVDGKTYIIDCGRGSMTQFMRAGLTMRSINAIFLTHLHADHTVDYYNYFLCAGHIPNPLKDNLAGPIPVLGPGKAGGLPGKFGGGTAPTIAPENPDPGTAEMTDLMHRAFAYSSNIFLRDMDLRDIRALARVREIVLPSGTGASFENTAPRMRPFQIFDDGTVRVSATLVPHGPVFPAYAFRFDTAYGSVTFSGDTRESENLIELGQDTDILVHEAIGISGGEAPPAVIDHMLQSHVLVDRLGPIAERCHAKAMVLSHTAEIFVEPTDPKTWERAAQRGYRGPVVFGQDLMRFTLGKKLKG